MRWLLTRGGDPDQEGAAYIYRTRPFLRLLAALMLLGGAGLVWVAFAYRAQGPIVYWTFGGFGLFFLLLGVIGLSSYLVLDEGGLHQYRWPRRPVTIPWSQLLRYEVRSSPREVTNLYLFRPASGSEQGTITVADTAFNVADLIARIRMRSDLRRFQFAKPKKS